MVEHVPDKNGVEGSIPSTRIWRGYGLVAEYVLAKDETAVRFRLPAKFYRVKFCGAKRQPLSFEENLLKG